MSDKPVIPTRIIPAGQSLPVPASPPPPPPVPPAPPGPDWWRTGSGSSGGGGSVEIHHHYYAAEPAGGLPSVPDPEPAERWWGRIRIGYNAACAAAGFGLCGPWAWVLAHVRTEESLAGAWVMATIPLVVLGFVDNARRIEALHADPELWAPRLKAAVARVLLWAAVEATALTLPITTFVYAITGVHA